jgi:hypothetical protein
MLEVKLSQDKLSYVEQFCMSNISPRLFYIHNKRGGVGWIIKRKGTEWVLELENEKQGLILLLKL